MDVMQKRLKENIAINWVICFKQSKKLIGYICFHNIDILNKRAEIGYALFFKYYRKGLMREAIKEIINYGFNTMNLHSIMANINTINIASQQLLVLNGFEKEAHFKEDFYFNSQFIDTFIYSLINPNHKNK